MCFVASNLTNLSPLVFCLMARPKERHWFLSRLAILYSACPFSEHPASYSLLYTFAHGNWLLQAKSPTVFSIYPTAAVEGHAVCSRALCNRRWGLVDLFSSLKAVTAVQFTFKGPVLCLLSGSYFNCMSTRNCLHTWCSKNTLFFSYFPLLRHLYSPCT